MQNNETVIREVKVSNWSIFKYLFKLRMIILLVLIVNMYTRTTSENNYWILGLVLLVIYVLLVFNKFVSITGHYYVVTNQRIIEKSRFSKNTNFVPLKQVSSVSVRGGGFFGTIFNYGSIFIANTGVSQLRAIANIKDPYSFSEDINVVLNNLK